MRWENSVRLVDFVILEIMETNDFVSQEFDTERFFDEFVESVGGELLKKRFDKSPTFNNADYFFEKGNVIAKLKSLKTDFTFNSPERLKKLQNIFDKWYEHGQITSIMISNPELLPPDFKLQTLRLFRKPIEGILKKASKQIKDTKKELGLENAKGLVIIFNDGFYGLTPKATIAVIGDVLRSQFPAIDGFVYITLRKRIDIPNDEHKRIVWLPKYREAENVVLGDFVNWLGECWFK
jgi:hypothetical protein